MRVLVSFPGRYGDILWAMPVLRALSRRLNQPIDLAISGEFASIVPLLQQQDYLGQVTAYQTWSLAAPESWRGPMVGVADTYDAILHLGYRGWPQRPLPFEVLDTLNAQSQIGGSQWTRFGTIPDAELDLQTPWITVDGSASLTDLAVGFTEAWFELKFGLLCCLDAALPPYIVLTPPGTRWVTEMPPQTLPVCATDWIGSARIIRHATHFLGDCSALHVLAVALGTPAVIMEPMEGRWNPIFWPLGQDGPQVTVVRGNDGRPSFDARAVRAAVEQRLTRQGQR